MRNLLFVLLVVAITGCGKSMTKILKSPDPEYKLRMAEKYFAAKKYTKAQVLYEDVIPFYKGRSEFEDIYYKYAYCAYNVNDYTQAEQMFKTYLELFPSSGRSEEIDYMRAYTFYLQSPKAELDQSTTINAINRMQIYINTHPGSEKNKDAAAIIAKCREKLERKEMLGAKLYYDKGEYKAAAVAYLSVLNNYPDSDYADTYKLMSIRSFYKYADKSVELKKLERFEKVVSECIEFTDRFPNSELTKQVKEFESLANNNIKKIKNEQIKTPA